VKQDSLNLRFETQPVERATTLSGFPLVRLVLELVEGLEMPQRRHVTETYEPLTPGRPTELVIALQPVMHQLSEGSRLRVSIAGADADNFRLTHTIDGIATKWGTHVGVGGSTISLPFLAAAKRTRLV